MHSLFKEDVTRAVETLRSGGIILYPTDTVWGIGCDATNPDAVGRVYALKRREAVQSMLVLMPDACWLERYVREVPDIAYQLVEVADKPLTLIYPGARNLAPNLLAEDGSVGIRIPHDDFCCALLQAFRRPLVSTSANVHGCPAAAVYGDISEEILSGADYVVGWRQEETVSGARPSSIIKIGLGGSVQIIRP